MRRIPVALALSISLAAPVLTAAALVPAAAASKEPVKLDGTVNAHGTKDVSTKSKAKLEVEINDRYFSPTFIKAKPGEKLTLELKNEGALPHTFTSDDLEVDERLDPGKSLKVKVTVPAGGTVFRYYCQFHEGPGMQGAVYTKSTGAKASSSSSTTSSGSPSYGY